ncbi:MAG: ATP-binding protein [Erysipelotrichales bacterium]|nr:ATP-binding protein [Erysipelotrichales bacterium]
MDTLEMKDFTSLLSEDLKKQMETIREAQKKKVLADPEVSAIRETYGLGAEAVEDYLSLIAKAVDAKKECASCVSLETCPYHPKGFRAKIVYYDGKIQTKTMACERMLKRDRDEKYLGNYLYSSVKKTDLSLSLEKLIAEDHSHGSVELLRMYVAFKDWTKDPDRMGLYLYGPSGSGKTYYATAAANDLAKEGKRVAYFNALTLAQQLRGNLLSPEELRDLIKIMNTADVLVLDGIGAETVTSAWRDMVLLPVLEYAAEEGKCLIVTSYGDYPELTEHFTNTVFRESDENKAEMIRTRIETMTRPIRVTRY